MGWFSKKKKQVPRAELPTIPRFPQQGQMPNYQRERQVPSPTQQPQFPDIAEHPVEYKPEENRHPELQHHEDPLAKPPETGIMQHDTPERGLMHREAPEPIQQPTMGDIPKREPGFMNRYSQREAIVNGTEEDIPLTDPAAQALQERREKNKNQRIPPRQLNKPPQTQMQPSTTEDKPLFVKIGQYREATTNIAQLKQKISAIEQLLTQLETIKTQEQTEIDNVKNELNQIREKLLTIDKQLFEV
jgi:hypothetical protein|tara:strand:- start:36180 stop:36914 length:735 start_codon:yes stop_codon:yes gene_type:complete